MLAGFTLAAMNVPQALGYTRIAGTPVVTGLYTCCCRWWRSRRSARRATWWWRRIRRRRRSSPARLSQMAPVASAHYVALAGLVALLTAGLPAAGAAVQARLPRRLPLADGAGRLSHRRRLPGRHRGARRDAGRAGHRQPDGRAARPGRPRPAAGACADAVPRGGGGGDRARLPPARTAAARPLFAVVGAIAASAAFDFSGHGIAVIGPVAGGLPPLGLPEVSWREVRPLLPVAGSCFLMIVAQSAATARAYASRHRETLDENADLVGLSAANAAAALSGTFVVNGSPTQTAMVESSGGRSQIAHLATAAVVALVLLFLTGPLQYLPQCVLGAIVFTIAVGLVDLRGLRDIRRESPGEFRLALVTAAVVVAGRRRAGHPAGDGAVAAAPRAPQLPAAHRRAGRGRTDSGGRRRRSRARRAGPAWWSFSSARTSSTPTPAASPRTCMASSTERPAGASGWWWTPARSPASITRRRACCETCNAT